MGLEDVFCRTADPLGSQIINMAILSAVAYVDGKHPLEQRLSPSWKKIEFTAEDRSRLFPRELISGLKFDFWSNPSKRMSVISFRGTNGLISWHANFHWLMRYLPIKTQYQKVREASSKLVNWIQAKNGEEFEIFVTGHSLGGGLAQHALYSHKSIKQAFVFNSTPVTAWNDIEEDVRAGLVEDNIVVRIHENGEILEFFRFLMKFGYVMNPNANVNPRFVEYRFNFENTGDLIEQHEMTSLADKFLNQRDEHCLN